MHCISCVTLWIFIIPRVKLFHQSRAADVNDSEVFLSLLIYHLFLLIFIHSFFDGDFLFVSHCSNQRMTQTTTPAQSVFLLMGCVWLFRVGQALRNARMINTQKTKQKWKERKGELKSISHYGHYSWLPSVIVTHFPKISLGPHSNLTAAQNVALRVNQ